jgi:pilus assembly protein Flp/PilA
MLQRFWRNESGATAIEYALIGGIVSIAIIAGASLVGSNLARTFTNIGNGLP